MLIDGLDQPAFVLGRRMDILATNRMARALLTDFDARPPRERNHTRWISSTPRPASSTSTGPSWRAKTSRSCATTPPSTLTIRSCASHRRALDGQPEFRTWWAEHDVATRNSGTKRYRHPVVGEMKIHFEAMRLADEDQLLFIYSVEPGTPSHDAMRLLATWAATKDAEAAHAATRDVDDHTSPMA
jgi:hypothetical protein